MGDPPYDPKLDDLAISKIEETEGVTAADTKTNLKAAYSKYMDTTVGVLESEAKQEYETRELKKAERELTAQRQMDEIVTTLQEMSQSKAVVEEVVEVVQTEEVTKKSKVLPPGGRKLTSAFADRPLAPDLSDQQTKDMQYEVMFRNRARTAMPGELNLPERYDSNSYYQENNMMRPASELRSKEAEIKKGIQELPQAE